MEKWCEIFKTGAQTSSNGITKEWSTDDLDAIIKNFEEKKNPVPVVIGHPKSNNPAYAWVDKLKRVQNSLYCTFKQVAPEFAEWVNKGLYKNRSISLYPDLTLRHVGFLGAVPPAIKGLEQFQFEEISTAYEYEFEEPAGHKTDNTISIFRFDNKNAYESPEEISTYCEPLGDGKEQRLTNKEITDYSEELKKSQDETDRLRKENEELKQQQRRTNFEQFAEKALEQGNITPAQKTFVVEFQEACHRAGNHDFSEGDETSVLKAFQNFISSIKQIDYSELPNGEDVDELDFSDPAVIAREIIAYKQTQADKGIIISESQALRALKKGAN